LKELPASKILALCKRLPRGKIAAASFPSPDATEHLPHSEVRGRLVIKVFASRLVDEDLKALPPFFKLTTNHTIIQYVGQRFKQTKRTSSRRSSQAREAPTFSAEDH
jgi:hypothetical protein